MVALDVVIAENISTGPLLCAGGTCGNVLTALAFLGWNSYPIARLRKNTASKRVIEDLDSWGVKLDFITLNESGSTPVVVQYIRTSEEGDKYHSFSRKCPTCGACLPWYKPVLVRDVADISHRLPVCDVFYFDRTSRSAVNLARIARLKGSLVFFEPSSESDPKLLREALEISHIVKIASNRARGNELLYSSNSPLLIIETLGSAGLQFRRPNIVDGERWTKLSALSINVLRDSAGAGDWCTAGIISALGAKRPYEIGGISDEYIINALKLGQAMGAWTCGFEGARGGMYQLSKHAFERSVQAILRGKPQSKNSGSKTMQSLSSTSSWCDCVL